MNKRVKEFIQSDDWEMIQLGMTLLRASMSEEEISDLLHNTGREFYTVDGVIQIPRRYGLSSYGMRIIDYSDPNHPIETMYKYDRSNNRLS